MNTFVATPVTVEDQMFIIKPSGTLPKRVVDPVNSSLLGSLPWETD